MIGSIGDHALDDIGTRICSEAIRWDRVAYPDAAGAAFLFPNDRPAWQLEAEKDLWSCEVFSFRVLVKVLRELGIDVGPDADLPYEPRQGIIAKWLPELGERLGALEHHPASLPEPGDVVLLQHPDPHASIALARQSGFVDSEDGGQIVGKTKGIRSRRRLYTVEGGTLYARDVDDAHSETNPGTPFPVLWIIRASRIAAAALRSWHRARS